MTSYSSEPNYFDSFTSFCITVSTSHPVIIKGVKGGQGPPLLLLHGHPQTFHIWHKIADRLAQKFTVVATDLRGYGESSKPEGGSRGEMYTKREMANDQVEVMKALGFEKFFILAHDRGARVMHRLALDHPQVVEKFILLDIVPAVVMYEKTTAEFAQKYWHWFFLIQPSPVPEDFIRSSPSNYLLSTMNRVPGWPITSFHPLAYTSYEKGINDPSMPQAMCADYRASAPGGLDYQLDTEQRESGEWKIRVPFKVFWGKSGVIQRCFDAEAEWGRVSQEGVFKGGRGFEDCGHYIPEEKPEELLDEVLEFFGQN